MGAAKYRGRFAPSPTGPLHFGSLVAAVASYCDARAAGGEWVVRMEDVDLPRCVAGADRDILKTLEAFGLIGDGPVLYQTSRTEAYAAALKELIRSGIAYPCSCSRKEIGDGFYGGRCRDGVQVPDRPVAWRVRVDDPTAAAGSGDFVVKRADGFFAYQLAVVVDDAFQGITDVVRGADLLESTARQQWLQRVSGYPVLRYLHVPLAVSEAGQKLSKQTLAAPVRVENAAEELKRVLAFLGQDSGEGLSVEGILRAAAGRWDRSRIPQSGPLQAAL